MSWYKKGFIPEVNGVVSFLQHQLCKYLHATILPFHWGKVHFIQTHQQLTHFLPYPIIFTHWSVHEAVVSLGHVADILGNQRSSTRAEANTSQIQYQFGEEWWTGGVLTFPICYCQLVQQKYKWRIRAKCEKCQSDGLPIVYWTSRPPFYVNDSSKYTNASTTHWL